MRAAAGILTCFGIDYLEPGVMQQRAHLIDRPEIRRGDSMVERPCGLAIEKAYEQAPLRRKNACELG